MEGVDTTLVKVFQYTPTIEDGGNIGNSLYVMENIFFGENPQKCCRNFAMIVVQRSGGGVVCGLNQLTFFELVKTN